MANFNFKLDFSKLEGFGKVTLTGKSGTPKRCVVIPITDNNVFEGEKGTYLDLVCIATPNSEYGSHMVTLSSTKEEREAGVRKPIVGNLKEFGAQAQETEEYTYQPQGATQQPTSKPSVAPAQEEDSDLPFSQALAA